MKLIKIMALLIAVLFALASCQGTTKPQATEEPQTGEEIFDLSGIVTEVEEGYISLSTEEHGDVHVNLNAETLFEGEKPVVGAYVHVIYNGQMTRSLPPQITALRVGCYRFTGEMADLTDERFTLKTELEEIVVNTIPGQTEGLKDGMTITVYFDGAMTMSLPAQIGAEHIVME